MLSIIISAVCSIISGMVLFLMQTYIKHRNTKDEESEKRQQKKYTLMIKSINALGKLATSNSTVINSAETSPDAREALAEYNNVNKEMIDYLIDNANKDWIIFNRT